MDTGSIAYRRAFEAYMRKGVPIDLSLKQARTTTHYIWRTRRDGKVRPSHAANDGKIFAWNAPPPTGHPGDDYGCRCTAEPFFASLNERIEITLSGESDVGSPWRSQDFVHHYFNGNGRDVTVRRTGHLRSIVAEYRRIVIDDPTRLPSQIANVTRQNKNRSFSDAFYNAYDMTKLVFSIGHTVIGGKFSGVNSEKNGILSISGRIYFNLEDEFKDPIDIFGLFQGNDVELTGSKPYRNYRNILKDSSA